MKKLWFTHLDLDGIGCAIMFYHFKQNHYYDEIRILDYKHFEGDFQYEEVINEFDEIVFSDISPDEKLLRMMLDSNKKITIIDHHQSFYDDLWMPLSDEDKEKINYHFDNNKSGTLLTFEYLKDLSGQKRTPSTVKDFVTYVNAFDLWKPDEDPENFEQGLNLHRLMFSSLYWGLDGIKKYENFIDIMVHRLAIGTKGFFFTKKEKNKIDDSVLREQKVKLEALKTMLVRTDKLGRKFGIVKMKSKVSINAYRILKQRKDLDYLIIINEYKKADKKVSVRTRKNNDINLLELRFTKGHEKACGTKDISQEQIEDLWQGRIFDLVEE